MTDYDAEIGKAADAHGLDVRLVLAVVQQESSGQTDAFRFEPSVAHWFEWRTRFPKLNARRACASYGLMQTLFATATDFGFTGEPEYLFVPREGLFYGCAYLASCLKWAEGDTFKALCAFNAGKSGWQAGRVYAGQVLTRMRAGV